MKSSGWSAPIETIKYRVYLVVLPIATLICAALYGLESRNATLHVVDQVGFPLFGTLCFGLFIALGLWPERLRIYEVALYTGFATFYLASLTYSLAVFAHDISGVWNLAGLTYWGPVLYTLAFLVFGVRLGLWASLSVHGVFGLAVMNYFLLRDVPAPGDGSGVMLLQGFAAGSITLFLLWAVGGVVAAQTRMTAQLELDAYTDPLTRLGNRRWVEQQLQHEAERARRTGTTFCVAFLDIDHFKTVNDEHGHDVGDRVLEELGQLLASEVRTLDIVGRWGGEEFLLLFPGLGLSEAQEAVDRLRLVVAQYDFSQVGRLSVSVGVAAFRPNEPLQDLLKRADRVLYRAKQEGRNRVVADHHDSQARDGELLN